MRYNFYIFSKFKNSSRSRLVKVIENSTWNNMKKEVMKNPYYTNVEFWQEGTGTTVSPRIKKYFNHNKLMQNLFETHKSKICEIVQFMGGSGHIMVYYKVSII